MRQHPIEKTRNIGIIAHIDAGKTTLTEAILYLTGRTHKIGEVHEGTTQMDWMAQERERGITITSAATTCYWKDHRINIIDTPGHIDFTAEVERSLRVLDGAVVVFDGKMGVEPQSETVWRQADKYRVPRLCFINKINQTGGDFFDSLKSIRQRLNPKAYPLVLPIGTEQQTKGVVDLITRRAYRYTQFSDKKLVECPIPPDMIGQVESYRQELLEAVIEFDDALLEQYLNGNKITNENFVQSVRKAVLSGQFFAVLGGDGRGVIVDTILDAIVDYLPAPSDLSAVKGHDPKDESVEIERQAKDSEPFCALAFKIASDPFVGTLTFFRIYSGVLKQGMTVINASTSDKERIGRMVRLHANHREDVSELYAGDIAAAVGLRNVATGHTLSDVSQPIRLESIIFPDPVISMAIEPITKADQEKLGVAMARLLHEDPTLRVSTDKDTGQTIISGMGELHLEITVDRLKREFSVEAKTGQAQVAYKETLKTKVSAEGKFIRQTGGRGQYGHVLIDVEPTDRGSGFEFVDKIKGAIIPKEFIPAVEKGIKEAMAKGVLAGYPVVDAKVTLYDGSYHDVDSSELAFQIAGSIAFQEAAKKSGLDLLEPIMKVEVIVPQDYFGDVMGDLNSRRAQITGTSERGALRVIDVLVPLAEMFGYATILRSMTQGRGSFVMEFDHYFKVPQHVASQIIGSNAPSR